MLDAQMIAAGVASGKAWDRFAPHFTSKELGPQAGFWFDILREWYTRDPNATGADRDALLALGKSKITNPKHEDTLLGWLRDLPDPPSADNAAQVALELKRHNVGMELAAAIGGNDHKRASALHAQYGELMAATALQREERTEWQEAVAVEDLFKKVGHDNRIALSPLILNERTNGGALPGHHILVYGRPEAGKSTFAINMAAGFALRKKRVLYVGNEDQIDILKSRMVSRIAQMTWEECERKQAACIKRYRQLGGEDYIIMSQLKNGTIAALRRKLDEVKPDVVVSDQIRNYTGSEGDSLTNTLAKVAIQKRNILLDYALIGVSVTQANDRTEKHGQEPPIWLGLGDIDSSRTGLPAQIDLAIGIGVNGELQSRNQRALSFPKNKLSSKPNAHEGVIVSVDLSLSHFK